MLRIAGIINDSIVDGPGLRMAVFVQGCDKDCEGCHNPEAQALSGGSRMTASEIIDRINDDPLLTGVTLSGGEPLLQSKELLPLARHIKEAGLELAIYTGDIFEKLISSRDSDIMELLRFTDVLIDGPFIISRKSLALPFRGSDNQRILDMPLSLAAGRAVISEDERWFPVNSAPKM